jgi:hypothetical protein
MDKEYTPGPRNAGQSGLRLPKAVYDLVGQEGQQAPSTPQIRLPQSVQALLGPQEVPAELETGIIPSIKRGAGQTFASLANLFGQDDWAQMGTEYALQFPKEVPDIQSVKSLSDLGTFAVESAAENVANMLLLGLGAVGGMFAGAPVMVGVGVTNFALQAGEAKMTVESEGGEATLANVGIPAALNTALDTFSLLKIAEKANVLSKTVKVMDEAAEASGLGARLKEGVKAGSFALMSEGSTEAIQSYNNMVAAKLATDKSFREAISLNGDDVDELLNSFAAGGLGAAVTAGPAAAVLKPRTKLEKAIVEKPEDETAVRAPRKAPIQPTEVDNDPMTGKDPQREAPPAPKDTAPIETGDEVAATQEAGKAGEPMATAVDPVASINELKAQVDNLRSGLVQQGEKAGTNNPMIREFGGVLLGTKDQRAVGENYLNMPMTQAIAPIAVKNLADGTTSNYLETGLIGKPGVYMEAGFASSLSNESNVQVQALMQQMQQKFMPNAKIVLANSRTIGLDTSVNGAMATMDVMGNPLYVIGLNSHAYSNVWSRQILGDSKEAQQARKDAVDSAMVATAMHEFGHANLQENFINEEPAVKDAVYADYQKWLDSLKTMSLSEYIQSRYNPGSTAYYMTAIPKEFHNMPFTEAITKVFNWNSENLAYNISFEEYAADVMARYAAKDKGLKTTLSKESKPFWTRMYSVFKAIFNEFKGLMKTSKTFTDWLTMKQLQNTIDAVDSIPLASNSVNAEYAQLLKNDFGKLIDAINLPINGAIRFNDQAGTLLDDAAQLEALRRHQRVSTGFTRRWGGRFLTPSQIAERYKVSEAGVYMQHVYDFHKTKMRGIGQADEVSKDWMRLPQAQADNLGRFVYDMSELSDRLNRRLSSDEMQSLREKHGINADTYDIYSRMDDTFKEILERLQRSLVKDVARQYTNDAEGFTQAYLQTSDPLQRAQLFASYGIEDMAAIMTSLKGVEDSFRQLRNRNYFPRMRFGSYTITVKRKEIVDGKLRTNVQEFLTFENQTERDKMYKEYLKDYDSDIEAGTIDIQASKLDDTTRSLYGMPQLVIDRIANSLRNPEIGTGLTDKQEQALRDISLDLSPGRRYLRHMQKRKNTAGFSTEAMRTYAAYMTNASNHLARVEHTPDMTAALRDLRLVQRDSQGDVTDLAELESYYTDHFKYLLNPENDWAKLRAFGFLWYLGFNVKSALVNTTQLPMVTYPYLASRYGDASTVVQMVKGMKDVVAHYVSRKDYSQAEQRLMDKLLEEGVIDESMASDLAGLSEGTALQRIMPTNKAHRVVNGLNYYGGYLFGVAEKFNRQATALAAFRLHMKETSDFDSSYKVAKDAIHKSQFEYAKYNRPEFMRGKKSAFFLFYNYTQQFLYLTFAGGKTAQDRGTAVRMMAMLFVMAGVQGLPFAEYILSTIDMLGTQLKKWTGMENPKVNIRQDIRELIQDLGMNPDVIMHGAGRFLGAGPLKILEMFGVPVPNLDISGSLSMGEPLPGFRTQNLQGSPSEIAGQLLLNGLGPIPNIGLEMWNAVSSTDPDSWKRLEKALPVFAKGISKAGRYYERGGETSRGGAQFLPYDGNDPYEAGEVIAQALGFTSTRLAQKRAIYGEQMSTALYWTERRQLLMERYAYAVKTGDKAAKAEALQNIREYNGVLTNKELKPYRISNANLKNSLRSKMRVISLRERGLPTTTRDRLIYRDVEESHE